MAKNKAKDNAKATTLTCYAAAGVSDHANALAFEVNPDFINRLERVSAIAKKEELFSAEIRHWAEWLSSDPELRTEGTYITVYSDGSFLVTTSEKYSSEDISSASMDIAVLRAAYAQACEDGVTHFIFPDHEDAGLDADLVASHAARQEAERAEEQMTATSTAARARARQGRHSPGL